MLDDVGAQCFVERGPVFGVVMLRADDHGVHAVGLAVAVFHGDLGLAVRPEVRQRAILADGGQPLHQAVGQVNGQRHQAVGFVAGEAHHDALVAGAGSAAASAAVAPLPAGFQRGADAGVDVGRLLAGVADDAARVAVDAVLDVGVADFQQGLAGDGVKVQVGAGGDFAGDHDEVLAGDGLAGDAAHGVNAEGGVQHGVGNLVANLVGVPFGDRLGGEQVLGRGHKSDWHWLVSVRMFLSLSRRHSGASRNSGPYVAKGFWIPAFAGMTGLGGNDGVWAGMTGLVEMTGLAVKRLGAFFPAFVVGGLLGGEGVDADAHGFELEAADFGVNFAGHHVDAVGQVLVALHQILGAEGLVGEAQCP